MSVMYSGGLGMFEGTGRKIKRAPAYHVLSIVAASKREF